MIEKLGLKKVWKIVGITIAVFAIVCFAIYMWLFFTAPIALSRFTRNMGLYEQSAWYAARQYDQSGNRDYLLEAVNISVEGGKDKNVIRYGEELVQTEDFAAYCQEKDAGMEVFETSYQYIYGRICVAYYNLGEGEKGLEIALSVNADTFVRYNAVTDLVYQAEYIAQDKAFAGEILEKLEGEYMEGIEDDTCLNEMILQLSKFIAQE